MTVNSKFFNLWTACAAASILLASGCGSDSPSPVAPLAPQLQPQVQAQPQTAVVQLGSHGGSVTLAGTSGGAWTLNGQPFSSNTELAGDNGLTYRLTLAGGTWTAEFVPPAPVSVALGTSGEQASLHLQEDGSYTLDQTPVAQGQRVTTSSGVQYELEQDPNGAWQANLVATADAGPAPSGPAPIVSGGVTPIAPNPAPANPAPANPAPADPAPADPPADPAPADPAPAAPPADPAPADPPADDSAADDPAPTTPDPPVPPPADPAPTTPDPPTPAPRDEVIELSTEEVVVPPDPGLDGPPIFSFRRARRTSAVLYDLPWGDHLQISGQVGLAFMVNHPKNRGFIDIGFAGEPVDIDANYVGRGRGEILTYPESGLEMVEEILGPIDDGEVTVGTPEVQELIDTYWVYINAELEYLFGGARFDADGNRISGFSLPQEFTQADNIAALRAVKTALSSVSSFGTYFSAQISEAAGPSASQLFSTTKRIVALGATTNTRFGVARIPIKERGEHPFLVEIHKRNLPSSSAAFIYSELYNTYFPYMPSTGTGTYNGHTWAVSQSQYEAYSGEISLRVDFTNLTVNATISSLVDLNGSAMRHNGRQVDTIALPTGGEITAGYGIAQFSGNGSATYTYSGGSTASASGWDWSGEFLSGPVTAAIASMGLYEGPNLEGAYGAERVP